MYKIELVNKKTKVVTIFDDVADVNYGEKLFFKFQINTTELEDGEYTLSLFEDDELLLTDTLCVGDFDVSGLQYKRGEDIYIETKLEVKTQDKSVEINSINTTILPDEGYNAMTTVQVNAQPVYDGAYNTGKEEGKQEGIEEGKAIQKGKLESITITENGVYTKEDGYSTVTVNVEDTNGSYDDGYTAGYDSGIEAQKGKLENLIVTENGEYTREDGYGKVTVDVGQISGINFSSIGYDKELSDELNAKWNSDVAYSKTLLDAWDPTKTLLSSAFEGDTKLVFAPNVDTSNATSMFKMFKNCVNLTTVPVLNTATVNNMTYMFEGCKSLKEVPLFDTSNVKDMNGMFADCTLLTKVPQFDTTNVTSMVATFAICDSLVTIPAFNVSNVTDTMQMFDECSNLQSVDLNTVNATRMLGMFQNCKALKTVNIKTDSATDVSTLFKNCEALESLPLLNFGKVTNLTQIFGLSNHTNLTELGGFKDLKIDWTGNYGLVKLPNLTYQSVMNVINNLYDFRSNGDSTTTKTIKFNSNHLAMLSDVDKAIATNKGWVIQS